VTPILTSEVFPATHVIPSSKLGDHEGLTLLVQCQLLKRTLLAVLPAILIQIPTRALLSPVPAYCRGQSGTSWCAPAPNSGKLSIGLVYFALFLLLLVLLVLLVKLICKVSLPFPPFPFLWWEGRG